MTLRRLGLTIDSRLEDVAPLAIALRSVCEESGVSGDDARAFELCVAEAVTNAIKHAYRSQGGHEVVVWLTLDEARVQIEIVDVGTAMPEGLIERATGPQFDPDDLESLPEGGMGLMIMKQVMDHVHYAVADGRNVLTLIRDRRPDDDTRAPS